MNQPIRRLDQPGYARSNGSQTSGFSLEDLPVDALRAWITAGEAPAWLIARLVDSVRADPSLIFTPKSALLATVRHGRPDLALVLESPEGDAWLERCVAGVRQQLIGTILTGLFR